jgi:hypothetical protein
MNAPTKLNLEPIRIGTGTVQVHDIFDPLPDFMREANVIYTDPPWNLSNLNNFARKAGRERFPSFELFYHRLFACIAEIRPSEAFVEVGKQHLRDFSRQMNRLYPEVTVYNNFYYRVNPSHIVHGSVKPEKYPLEGLDDDDAVRWVCQHVEYDCIGDLCMGQGITGWCANSSGRKFVGTELNQGRLQVLIRRITEGKFNVR